MSLRIGSIAPNFKTETTKGEIDFHTFKANSWAILFSHPADFTPVCTTELGQVAKLKEEWKSRSVLPIGLSCNDLDSHGKWIQDINETQNCNVDYPIIADPSRKIAKAYNMLDQEDSTNVDAKGIPLTVRSVFIIDKLNKIRAIITYPASTGRNFDEIIRVIDSLQLTDNQSVATPVNWQKGDDVVILPSVSDEKAHELFPGFKTIKPYLRTTNLK